MPPDESDDVDSMHYFSLFIKFRQISSKINIFIFHQDGQFSLFRQFFVKNETLWSLTMHVSVL